MLRIISGAAAHPLDGPGMYNGTKVVGAPLAGRVSVYAKSQGSGAVLVNQVLPAGSAVGTALAGGVSLPQDAQLWVTLSNASDKVEVDMSGPYG